ncbi:Integrase core domain [Popillia japonica]|uniref:Integrase core domain n=1 Tax=Popillia japonica TaxID=7064 RepID=A0AAW1K2G0_POPJA
MRKKVKSYIDMCVECAYHKVKGAKKEGELHNIERVPIPFHTVNIDHLGPFPKSSKGNTHVLVYVDNFTKYTYIEAVKDTKTRNVTKTLETIFGIFGPPQRLISDRGTAFTSAQFNSFMKENSITHIKTATAMPRANGQVARHNKTITTAITSSYKREDGRDWDVKIKPIQYAINSIPNRTTGQTAHW